MENLTDIQQRKEGGGGGVEEKIPPGLQNSDIKYYAVPARWIISTLELN